MIFLLSQHQSVPELPEPTILFQFFGDWQTEFSSQWQSKSAYTSCQFSETTPTLSVVPREVWHISTSLMVIIVIHEPHAPIFLNLRLRMTFPVPKNGTSLPVSVRN